jgi:hypothetical protein
MRPAVTAAAALRDRVMGMVARGWVRLVYRNYPMQALRVEVLKDELSDATEHFQPYGFTSFPLEGMDALLNYVSGDRSHAIVSVVADRTSRPRNLREGDVAIYHSSDHPTASAAEAKHQSVSKYPVLGCRAYDQKFQAWRDATIAAGDGRGGDIMIYTEIKAEDLPEPYVYFWMG